MRDTPEAAAVFVHGLVGKGSRTGWISRRCPSRAGGAVTRQAQIQSCDPDSGSPLQCNGAVAVAAQDARPEGESDTDLWAHLHAAASNQSTG